MTSEKIRRMREIIVESEEEINAGDLEDFNRKILTECGIAGLLSIKERFTQAKTGLGCEIDGFLKNYKLDEYQNLYNKDGTTLISYNEDVQQNCFEVPNGVMSIGDRAFK